MSEFLLEFLSEEIPARMQLKASQDLAQALTQKLKDHGLTHQSLRTYVTPRRLTAVVEGLCDSTTAVSQERRGPKISAPEAALQGFLKSAGVLLEQCTQRDGYWYVTTTVDAQQTVDILPVIIRTILREFSWPKSMRWAGASQTWVRPLRGVLALYKEQLLSFDLPEFALSSTNRTVGHRFLEPQGSFEVKNFENYCDQLISHHVILDHQERQTLIASKLSELGESQGYHLEMDEKLLEEVAGLVEFPQPLLGRIDDKFMSLPKPVLVTAMRVHQKYFTFTDKKGLMAPVFGLVANTIPTDGGKEMLRGYQRVLTARLSDAAFFYNHDVQIPLGDNRPKLDSIIFHARLGTLGQRVDRLKDLVESGKAKRAATLCKSDLVSSMVGEFPELQGIMGENYALAQGESMEVAQAIREHYQPQGPTDDCPKSPISVELALAEKLDTLVGFFAIGEIPTGSKDPYALRRAALGIIRLIRENNMQGYPLRKQIEKDIQLYQSQRAHLSANHNSISVAQSIMAFILDRLSHALRGEGIRHDAITAVIDSVNCGEDILAIVERVKALHHYLDSDSGLALQGAFRRAYGILSKEKWERDVTVDLNLTLFQENSEKKLYEQLSLVNQHCQTYIEQRDFTGLMNLLSGLRAPVDDFFELKINHDDPMIRTNRLALLGLFVQQSSLIADFSKLEGV